ncbi:DUF5753 domain-containing protein [Plantactinospora sp. B5E13]|uniref:DUF5753 domain-containing protein n=1 Tax=unclassified Plantactinospora TaxID=2631981 RepID=UPI00325F43F8
MEGADKKVPLSRLSSFETEASAIFGFEPLLVPGLLQTADYTRALMKACGVPDPDAQFRVAARLGRQAVLTRDESPEIHAVLDEGVLRRALGGPAVMARQLRHLLEMARRPRLKIQVVPLAVGGHTGLDGGFSIIDFPRHKSVVHLEHKLASLFLEEPADVATFRRTAEALAGLALSPAESIEFIARVADEHERV